MEIFLTGSALSSMGYMLRDIYKYYKIKNIAHLIKTSIQLDTSFETVTKELNNKNILLASSIKNIEKNGQILNNEILSHDYNHPHDLKDFYFTFNSSSLINLSNFESDEISLYLNNKKLWYFDAPGLKTLVIKNENKLNEQNYNSLSILEKIRLYPIANHEK
jgi:hypothetical protein